LPTDIERFILPDEFERYRINKHAPLAGPRYLQVELTDHCNLTCPSCVRSWTASDRVQLDLAAFGRLLDETPTVEQISFVGAGEALIVREFPAYVAASHALGITTTTNTNGLLVKRRLGAAVEAGLSNIAISVDGASDVSLNTIRSGLTKHVLEHALRSAVEITDGTFCAASAAVTLSLTNLSEFSDMVRMIADNGITNVTVESLHHWGTDKSLNDLSLFAGDPDAVVSELERGLATAVRMGITVAIFDYRRLHEDRSGLDKLACAWPFDSMYITRTGAVTPCCVNIEEDSENLMGRTNAESALDIWGSEKYEALRGSLLTGTGRMASCEDCVYRMEFGGVV
jgi:MoaA/NifB/PqqE/SkfB family radical SAM enzyme